MMMELFHTSADQITEINSSGRFGEFLFFSANVYTMGAGEYITYRIDIDDNEIIDAASLFYHENAEKLNDLVERVMGLVDCDEDTAEDLIAQEIDVFSFDHIDPADAAELSWDIQAITAQAAKRLGFRGVSMQDEQGTCYMIDMMGREKELETV